ncbi:hypothetical protein GCM10009634_28330 [Saccharothrix xinjiangensis]
MDVHAERPGAQSGEGGGGQRAVGGRGITGGQGGGHGLQSPTRAPSTSPYHPREPRPTMRMEVDHGVDAWHAEAMTSNGIRLVVRRHVDFRRVSSAMCRCSA